MSQKNTYEFDIDLQQEILQFTVTDLRFGFKAIPLFKSEYFTTVPHALIAEALHRYYDKKFAVPSLPVMKEELRQLFRLKQWQSLMMEDDKETVMKILKRIYRKPVRNAESIYEACKEFAQYSAMKDELENVNLDSPSDYPAFHARVLKAINIGSNLKEDKGMFLLRDAKSRVTRRADSPPGYPTPYWQLNTLFNSNGTSMGNVIVVMGEEKKFKTGFLLNTARGYLKRGKVILYADFENGEDAIGTRADQGLIGTDRKTLISGTVDKKLLKMARQYARFGGEIVIKRFSAGQTTKHIEAYMDNLRSEFGLNVEILLCDYPDVMGSTDNQSDETKRISQVYIDIKTLANDQKIQATWCPSHINREAGKEKKKKRTSGDIAKALDKVRHADVVLSIEQSPDEKEAGIIRAELVVQRDGPQDGRIYFFIDFEKQRIKEFNKTQVDEMEALRRESENENKDPDNDGRAQRFKNKKEVSDL